MVRLAGAFGALFLLACSSASAGIYGPEDVTPFKIRPDGTAEELPYVPNFKSMLDERLNVGNDKTPLSDGGKPTFRGRLLGRIEQSWPAGGFPGRPPASAANLPQDRQAALAAELIRVGRVDDAVNLLQPRARDRNLDFSVLLTLAQAYAARGEWELAIQRHADAFELAEVPKQLPGASVEQTRWLVSVERVYAKRWLSLRKAEATKREPVEDQDVMPIFPVQFVNDRGTYEPGVLAAAEKAKLPPDAVAIVQQLLLWSPDDPRLLWLLAELTAVAGRFGEASEIFFQCTWARGFTNRKKLMDHRTAVDAAAKAQAAARTSDDPILDTPPPAEKPQQTLRDILPETPALVGIAASFGVLILLLVALQVRAILRRVRRK